MEFVKLFIVSFIYKTWPCLQYSIGSLNKEANGWEIEETISPDWFTGLQLPPSYLRKKPTSNTNDYYGNEESDKSLRKASVSSYQFPSADRLNVKY